MGHVNFLLDELGLDKMGLDEMGRHLKGHSWNEDSSLIRTPDHVPTLCITCQWGHFRGPRESALASYPGLLAPAFVTCSTNAGEGLVKLSHVVWHTWTCGGVRKTASKWVHWLQAWTVERLNTWHQTVLTMFLGFRKLLYSCTEGMCHSSPCPSPF